MFSNEFIGCECRVCFLTNPRLLDQREWKESGYRSMIAQGVVEAVGHDSMSEVIVIKEDDGRIHRLSGSIVISLTVMPKDDK